MTGRGETPMVIAPDIILDLIFARGSDGIDALMLFDAIAEDQAAGVTSRRAYIAQTTLPEVYAIALHEAGMAIAKRVAWRLMQLVVVAPTTNADYSEALGLASDFELSEAVQFVACRSVGARYLVTNEDFGVKRAPVHRRTAAEMLPFFRK